MILLSRLVLGANARLLQKACCSHSARQWKSTINIDRSLELGSLIPNINIEDAGIATHIGKRQYQEDRCSLKLLKDGTIYLAMFDGHGGSLAADYTEIHMPLLLESVLENKSSSIAGLLEQTFIKVSSNLLDYVQKRSEGMSFR